MPSGNAGLRGPGLFILAGKISLLLGTALPAACNHGGGLTPSDGGATGGANGGTAVDGAATGGTGGQVGDGSPFDHPVGSGGGSAVAGAAGTPPGGTGGSSRGTGGGDGARGGSAGASSGGGGATGGTTSDAGPPDLAPQDGGMAQGGAGGGIPGDGSAPGDGAPMDGGSADVMFPCGPCSPHWYCGGYGDATETDITLTPEEDGCYLAGLAGHVLLAPDGTLTENGVPIGRAQKLGPQVQFYRSDGSQWFFCGGNLPCSP